MYRQIWQPTTRANSSADAHDAEDQRPAFGIGMNAMPDWTRSELARGRFCHHPLLES
jgi:hypothetical protein